MPTLHTVRVRQDWLDRAIGDAGGMSALAEALKVHPSTITRYARGEAEAGPRFIGAVLTEFALDFDDAFSVVEEGTVPTRPRLPKKAAA